MSGSTTFKSKSQILNEMLPPVKTVSSFTTVEVESFENPSSNEDLTLKIRPLLIIGRIIGVIPYSGIFTGKTAEDLKFRFKSIGTIMNCVFSFWLGINVVIGTTGFFKSTERGAHGMAANALFAVLNAHGCCSYMFFLFNAEEFLRILKEWKRMAFYYVTEDKHLRRDVVIIVGYISTSLLIENATYHAKLLTGAFSDSEKFSGTKNQTSVPEYFYRRASPIFKSVVPYHPVVVASIFITNKLCLYSREFGDIFIIVISRTIYVKFKLLIRRASEELTNHGNWAIKTDSQKWKHLMNDFETLLRILASFERFLSPLIFMSFTMNVYYISFKICRSLHPHENQTIADILFTNWSFLHGIVRCYLVALSAAKINEHASSIRSLIAKCPQEFYSSEFERFEYQMNNLEIGLSGFGAFTVTKSFMLKLVGVIFTVEIVLLQSTLNK